MVGPCRRFVDSEPLPEVRSQARLPRARLRNQPEPEPLRIRVIPDSSKHLRLFVRDTRARRTGIESATNPENMFNSVAQVEVLLNW
jgi:hypothetical protein